MLSENPMWEAFGLRALTQAPYRAGEIRCPALLTMAEGDPTSQAARKLYDALPNPRKALVSFSTAEGAGGHCEALARSLYEQRVFDWLDETIGGR